MERTDSVIIPEVLRSKNKTKNPEYEVSLLSQNAQLHAIKLKIICICESKKKG